MKYEWRKQEKEYYLPKNKPQVLDIPQMKFCRIHGEGNPNDKFFSEYIGVLYSLSYAVRMIPKKGMVPEGYFEYTVYPLEGEWSLTEKGIAEYDGIIDKDQLAFNLMIRQPDFVTADFADEIINFTKKQNPHTLLDDVEFSNSTEGLCVQMLHEGPYDNEPASFCTMEEFCNNNNLKRKDKNHREIYITDARKTVPEKLKTVLRFKAEETDR